MPSHFPDGAVASAMLLWAEDVDVPLDTARQAVQHVHDEHMAKVTQHGTASHVALAEPLQSLMIFFFFFLGGKDIHYTSAMIATSRVCDVHHKPKRPNLTTHLEWFRHES